ncbi:hypothetical protein BIFCAT_01183 [Bifidobacterium catenulatum DSM 16992 = JCM 1194 = LMG 11043]|uniref:Uncharacterized protein n=1 Tax=Bifidobacterium catenulatum DSM 16992 = JCM 1194 = LMG 11043 TaxID=566552 RepID=B6XVF4_9BIFI|nr:hypothetical protein BIFCAT_01183 [Bifidobacterium catenulatum DSM 16992 = JCM 1194 = LMG 11043]
MAARRMPSMREFVEDLNARIGAEWLTTASTPDHLPSSCRASPR